MSQCTPNLNCLVWHVWGGQRGWGRGQAAGQCAGRHPHAVRLGRGGMPPGMHDEHAATGRLERRTVCLAVKGIARHLEAWVTGLQQVCAGAHRQRRIITGQWGGRTNICSTVGFAISSTSATRTRSSAAAWRSARSTIA